MAAIRASSMGEVNGVNGDKGTWGSPDPSNQEVSGIINTSLPFVRNRTFYELPNIPSVLDCAAEVEY
jgi:hypothetical protein